jgi:phosphate transport system permease protein
MSEPQAHAAHGPHTDRFESIVGGKSAGMSARYLRDRLARWVVWIGGLGVIGALLLIFVYLLSEVLPLFAPAEIEPRQSFSIPGPAGRTVFVASEEQGEVGLRVTDGGSAVFFDLYDGELREQVQLPFGDARVLEVTELSAERGILAALLDDGTVGMFRHRYLITYPQDRRLITPQVELPYGDTPLAFVDGPARSLVVRSERGVLMFAAVDPAGQVALKQYERQESLFGDVSFEEGALRILAPAVPADSLLLDPLLNWLYVFDHAGGRIALYRLEAEPRLIGIYETGSPIRTASYLAGGISVVVAQADGVVSQWFPARDKDSAFYLARVREFRTGKSAISAIGPELRRRTFAVGDDSGNVALFYATSGSRIAQQKMLDEPVAHLSFNPRAQYLMAVGVNGQMRGYDVHNEHPEVSLRALWGRVWYESYDEPKFLWQSSAATADFEPKLSLTPLSFGTLKAAFYAMIFAVPLAILGAIYTANFMSPQMRQAVKPTVELMEALPTVILGFLAGLWLAPFVETNLPGVFLTLIFLPLSIPLFGLLWTRVPRNIRLRVPPGWEAAMLLPVIALIVWACFVIAKPVEALFFAGNMQAWMDRTLGIGYDQRNALVVGIAMGIAVIPTIYSIAEDAIFSVPKQLSLGSLALGATPWQTLVGVVLPTASPGIFSAVMIGMGRAVGETMIVLMATGNTAVMDFSVFQGLRTLSANIAVEMPESEVGSTHFRLLFMAGLVLFVFTFLFNTLAEVVRQRLRQKYSTI